MYNIVYISINISGIIFLSYSSDIYVYSVVHIYLHVGLHVYINWYFPDKNYVIYILIMTILEITLVSMIKY